MYWQVQEITFRKDAAADDDDDGSHGVADEVDACVDNASDYDNLNIGNDVDDDDDNDYVDYDEWYRWWI